MNEELAEDLKTTSAQVSATAERLDALEATKRKLDPDDPRVIELSDEVERLAAQLRRQAAVEGDLTREIRNSAMSEASGD
jgi:DNA-binding MarR family transcriptional regulator